MVRVTCPGCGDVGLPPGDIRVLRCTTTDESSFAFRCPSCRLATVKQADPWVVDVLLAAGTRQSVWHLPAELDEAKTGPPITHDDLLEFHFLLDAGICLSDVFTGGTGPSWEKARAPRPANQPESREPVGTAARLICTIRRMAGM